MKRIIMHWTGGAGKAGAADRGAYHWIVEADGAVVKGDHDVAANAGPIEWPHYAAHTANLNTGSIGIAMAGMHDANERPFRRGKHPLTEPQVDAFVALVAQTAAAHAIPVTGRTVLSHAEVQPTLGVAQRAKWDITWIPGMGVPEHPVRVGDVLRARILAAVQGAIPVPGPTSGQLLPDHVAAVQAALSFAATANPAFHPGPADGLMGPRTRAALRAMADS